MELTTIRCRGLPWKVRRTFWRRGAEGPGGYPRIDKRLSGRPSCRMRCWCLMMIAGGGLAGPAAAADPPEAASPKPEITRISATRSRLGVIEFDHTTREITLPAEVNMVRGLLEYALVGEKGKLHEALLSTKARAFDLNVVLLLLSYQPDEAWFVPPAKPRPLDAARSEARVEFLVRWKDAGGGPEKSARLDEWITDLSTRKPAAPAPWIYTGSHLNEENRFAAEVDGSIVALYLDARALINSPREGADNDEQWVPAEGIPPRGTPVTVVIRPSAAPKK